MTDHQYKIIIEGRAFSLPLGPTYAVAISNDGVYITIGLNENKLKVLEILIGMGAFRTTDQEIILPTGSALWPQELKLILKRDDNCMAVFTVVQEPTFAYKEIKEADRVHLKFNLFCYEKG